jgi:hypothetical protein
MVTMMRSFLALLATLTSAPVSAELGVRTFGGWMAGCDNENICTAIRPAWDAIDVLPRNSGMPFVQIRHHPQRDAVPEITLIDQTNPSPDAVLKPPLAIMVVHYDRECKCKTDCPENVGIYHARIDGKGGYKFKDEEARTVLYGLRKGNRVLITLGDKRGLPLDVAHLDEALAHFDREQKLADTPGALVLQPDNVMYDYAHPHPPFAPIAELTGFNAKQLKNWRAEYPKPMPGEVLHFELEPKRGITTLLRTKSPDGDCGVFERWGHVGTGNDFVLVKRREMPVCSGIAQQHWIRTYRADTISRGKK